MKNQKTAARHGTDFSKATGRWALLVVALQLSFVSFARAGATAPVATTLPATAITSSGAMLNGSVNPSNSPTSWYFQYGLNTSYGSFSATNSLPATNVQFSIGASISGLTSNTLYHFALVASNSAGTTNGGDLTFLTPSVTPIAIPQSLGWVFNIQFHALSGVVAPGPTNFTIVGYPTYGQLTLMPGFATNGLWAYEPFANNFPGTDSFLFEVSDTNGILSAPAQVTITVTNVPYAFSQSVSLLKGTTPSFRLTGIVDDVVTNFNVVKSPTNGILVKLSGFLNNGLWQYNPTNNTSNSAPDNFTFNVSDSFGNTSAVATVTVILTNVPYAFNQSVGWLQNTFPTNQLTGIVASGPTNFVILQQPLYGQVTPLAGFNTNGYWTYKPYASNFFGADSFAFTVHDTNGNNSAPGIVHITVINVPAAPFAHYQYLKTRPNQPLTIYLSGDDDGNDPRFPTNNTPLYARTRAMSDWNPTFTLLSSPTNGVLTGPVTNLTYTPTNANVFDSFTFKVNNGYLDSAPATVMIKIAPYNIGTNYFDANFSLTPSNTNHSSDVTLLNPGTVRPGFENGAFTLTNGIVEQDSGDLSHTPVPGSSRTDDGMILITNLLDRLGRPRLFNFYGQVYTNFWIDNNGLLSFTAGISNFYPSVFPASPTLGPLLAPLWCDVDTRSSTRGGVVSYGQGYVTDQGFLGEPAAAGRPALIITWNDVGSYSQNTASLNRFQAVMIDRSDLGAGVFDFEANYEYVEWLMGAVSSTDPTAGFDLGDGIHYFNFPGSLTPAATNLPSSSNLLPPLPGRTLYRISFSPTPPSIASFTVTNIGTTSAQLSAVVNPYGPQTSIVFNLTNQTLGTTMQVFATNLPSDSVTPMPVTLTVDNLQSGSTYVASIIEVAIGTVASNNPVVTFGTVPRLSSLSVNSGNLLPAFAPNITGYLVQVSNAPSITLSNLVETPTTNPILYQINSGGYVSSNGPFALQWGYNPVNVKVTSSFGVTGIYTVNVLRTPSTDSSLAGLTLSSASFSPGFSPTILSYSATVSPLVTNLFVTAWTTSPYARLQINSDFPAATTNSAAISTVFGTNLVSITVTAQDGTTTTYLLDVTRTSAAPVVTLLPVSQITKTNAVLNATVNPQGTNASVYFQYGLDTNYGSLTATAPVPTAVVDEPVNVTANGLSPGTTYHYRAVASNVFGFNTSGDMEFITIGVPVDLAIAKSPAWPNPANVLLTWPTNAIGAQLESSGLQLPPNWQPVTNPVNQISGSNTVSIPVSTNAQFFRLNYP